MPNEEEGRLRTLCEINCQLVNANAGPQADLSGVCCPDVHLSECAKEGVDSWSRSNEAGDKRSNKLQVAVKHLLSSLPACQFFVANTVQTQQSPPASPLAWHMNKPLLAIATGLDKVAVCNFSGKVPSLGQPPIGTRPPPPLAPTQTLTHELQHGVTALAWRPNSSSCLAVVCTEGICLWRLGGAGSRGRSGGAWMTWLGLPAGACGPLCCLSWHPRGHLLAGGLASGGGMCVWDVATGACWRVIPPGTSESGRRSRGGRSCGQPQRGAGQRGQVNPGSTQPDGCCSTSEAAGLGRAPRIPAAVPLPR